MAGLDAAVDTPAGKLTLGKHYNLTLRHGSSERELKRAKIVAFEHTGVGLDERLGIDAEAERKLRATIPTLAIEIRYQAETRDQVVGFLSENIVNAKEV